jgi:hypothetical protein
MATLLVSFWDLCLDNFPEGSFAHRKLNASQAKEMIDSAKSAGDLIGVTADDLFAEHATRRAHNHKELRRVLSETYNISLDLEDFVTESSDEEGQSMDFVNGLNLYGLSANTKLLLITCCYEFSEKDKNLGDDPDKPFSLGLVTSHDTVEFHLFEAIEVSDDE